MQRILKVLNTSAGLNFFAGGLFAPIYALFVEEIGGGAIIAGTAYSIFAIVAGILIFFIGKWEDHIKHQERLVVIGYVLSCIGFLGYILVDSPIKLFAVEGIFGIATAVRSPAFSSLYSKNLDKGKYASEWGTWESIGWVVIGFSALIGGYLANLYGFKILFILMFLVSLISLFVSILLIYKKKK